MAAIVNYFKDAYRELELVRWPTRQQAVRLSVIVFFFTFVSAVIFGLVDFALGEAVYFLTNTIL